MPRQAPVLEGRLRVFDDAGLMVRDPASLDVFWLKDDALADRDKLPPPDVISQEIVDDLVAALAQCRLIAGDLAPAESGLAGRLPIKENGLKIALNESLVSAVKALTNRGKTQTPSVALCTMQIPPIDRIQGLRPVVTELASLTTGRVVPVAPVNPAASPTLAAQPSPSVINMINQADKPNAGEGVYSSVSDPTRKGAAGDSSDKDWTIQRPAPEKVQDLPQPPMTEVLMDHLKSLWLANTSAGQVQQQVKNQLDSSPPGINATAGVLVSEVLTYSPSKINKTDKTQT